VRRARNDGRPRVLQPWKPPPPGPGLRALRVLVRVLSVPAALGALAMIVGLVGFSREVSYDVYGFGKNTNRGYRNYDRLFIPYEAVVAGAGPHRDVGVSSPIAERWRRGDVLVVRSSPPFDLITRVRLVRAGRTLDHVRAWYSFTAWVVPLLVLSGAASAFWAPLEQRSNLLAVLVAVLLGCVAGGVALGRVLTG
jgi:hypothetical protein